MYQNFYGLKEKPFSLMTDPSYLYYSNAHFDAMSHLLYGVRERKGLMLLLGEAGTGKTTLIKSALRCFAGTRVVTSAVLNPHLESGNDLLDYILQGFGVAPYTGSLTEKFRRVERLIITLNENNHIPVLVVDEAQILNAAVLQQLRLISNINNELQRGLQIILAAQPELEERLEEREYRALRQRITVRHRLRALTTQETYLYIATRLSRAGAVENPFTPEAMDAVFTYSGGCPRMINVICDNALLAGFGRSDLKIAPEVVGEVARHFGYIAAVEPHALGLVEESVVNGTQHWKDIAPLMSAGEVPEALRSYLSTLVPSETSRPQSSTLSVASVRS
jgi:general secretion pathway protein A